jgi:hypothetical protein
MLAGQDTLLHLPTHTNSDVLVAIRKLAPHEGLSKHCVYDHWLQESSAIGEVCMDGKGIEVGRRENNCSRAKIF